MAIDLPNDTSTLGESDLTIQRLADSLCSSHNIVAAKDLYAYHVLPSITADLESMDMTSDLQYHAVVQAELRWSFLNAQQQQFWHRQIEQFMDGDMKPLDSTTYEDFCARRNLLHDDLISTPGDEQGLSGVPSTPLRFLGSKATGSVEHALSERKPTVTVRRSARLMEKAQNAETCDFLRRAWIRSRRRDESGANELPPRGLKAAKNLESTPFQRAAKANDRIQLSATNGVEATGQLLPRVPPPYNDRRLEVMTSDVVSETNDGLVYQQDTNINHAYVHPAPPVATTKKRRSKRSRPIRASGIQNNDHDSAIVHVLGGPVMQMQLPDYTTGISAILQSISKRLSMDPDLTLQGRCRSSRVDFDPRAVGIASIRARYTAAQARGDVIDLHDRKMWRPKVTIGFMLRFLVDWNRHSRAFQDCRSTRSKPKTALKCSNEFAPRWTWLECRSEVIGPVTYERRYTVIGTIMLLLRERAQKLCPAALTTGVYGLLPHDRNFACTLLTCFTYTTFSPEDYQDLLEQKMFRLNRRYGRLYLMQR